MNLYKQNKVDLSFLSPDEQQLFHLYGKLPSKYDHLAEHCKERKYFDSGDFALFRAGKASSVDTESVGSQHPLPENIPHLTSPAVSIASQGGSGNSNIRPGTAGGSHSVSPVKESSFLSREMSVDKQVEDKDESDEDDNVSPLPAKDGNPIGR
ncbi:hypothetical protein B7463_g11166, partial [Scytalidium lignicola]